MNEIERIRLRCVCEDGGCWTWKGATTRGLPVMAQRREDGTRVNVSARKVVLQERQGRPITGSDVVMTTCGNGLCLNPAHLKRRSRSYANKVSASSAAARISRAKAARARWDRDGKLSLEKARAIRASDKPQRELAAEHGVCQTLISQVQLGRLWREPGNPFAALLGSTNASRGVA